MRGAVHDITVNDLTSIDTDSEGRTAKTPTPRVVRGSAHLVTANEREIAAQAGEQLDAVVRLPLDDPIGRQDEVELDADEVGSVLAGVYAVTAVRTNRSHLRVTLRRLKPPS